MNQRRLSNWLKGVTVAVGVIAGLILLVLIPSIGYDARQAIPERAWMFWPSIAYDLIFAAMFFWALARFFAICSEIGRDNSFSHESAQALTDISRLSLTSALFLSAGGATLFLLKCLFPLVFVGFLTGVVACVAVSVASAVLSHLVLKAALLKDENELTV